MSLTRVLRIIALTITLAVPAVVSAQVPVEVSGEKIISGGRVYYLHEVQKSQTLYSISKAYRVSIDVISRENVIPLNGIQTGQILRIPAPDQQAAAVSQTRPVAQPAAATGQTRAATQPAATTTQNRPAAQPARHLVSGVPGIDISSEKIVSGGKTFFMHEVKKGQTLYSIAKAYKVTILDIDRENSIPPGGLQEGQVLRIPVSSALTVIEESTSPSATVAQPGRSAGEGTSGRSITTGTAIQGQETAGQGAQQPGQQTQMPRQETPRQEAQLPHEEQPAARAETTKEETEGTVTLKTAETKETAGAATRTEAKTGTEITAQQQTASSSREEVKPKPAAVKKKIHKVQKGESLADIAKKYGITVQELKQANKGVIFAMPDMRLVIPAEDEQ